MLLTIDNLIIKRGEENKKTITHDDNHEFIVSVPSLNLARGEVIALQGISGSGKSSILEVIGLILKPHTVDKFQFNISAEKQLDLKALLFSDKEAEIATVRARNIGFMLQTGGLLPYLTVEENIALSSAILQTKVDKEWLSAVIDQLQVTTFLKKYPAELSIGQRQRVAFIKAIAHKPSLLLADEPTASLDPVNANNLIMLIIRLAKELNIGTILVTHDPEVAVQTSLAVYSPELRSTNQTRFVKMEI